MRRKKALAFSFVELLPWTCRQTGLNFPRNFFFKMGSRSHRARPHLGEQSRFPFSKEPLQVNRHYSALLSLFLIVVVPKQVAAQTAEVCANLFAQGYYDEHQTFSDRRNFKYVQSIICSDTKLTRDQAAQRSLDTGGTYLQAITGFENYNDSQKSFEEQRSRFCSMNLDTATASDSFIQKTRIVSQAATDVMKACLELPGFHAAIVPSRNPESFGIYMTNNGQGKNQINVNDIEGNPSVTCKPSPPVTMYSGQTILCSKPAEQTVQVTMNADQGGLKAIDVLGTTDINNDIQNQLKVLTDKVAAMSHPDCLGCIDQSVLSELEFQNANGSSWVLCKGQSIIGSKLAQATGKSTVPDLRGVFLRGKSFGQRGVGDVETETYQEDAVGPHSHTQRYYDPSAPDTKERNGQGIFWNGGYKFSDGPGVFVQGPIPASSETRPKNVTVNFFCKVN
jgi:hypothetical protein